MKHRSGTHRFGRRQGPRIALLRGLVDALVENGRIRTTLAKAKELRRHVERAVTMGKKNTLHVRRVLMSRYPNLKTVDSILKDVGPRFANRPGGYTRILKVGTRPGDQADMAIIEFVDYVPKASSSGETVKGDKSSSAVPAKQAQRKQVRSVEKKRKSVRRTQKQAKRTTRKQAG